MQCLVSVSLLLVKTVDQHVYAVSSHSGPLVCQDSARNSWRERDVRWKIPGAQGEIRVKQCERVRRKKERKIKLRVKEGVRHRPGGCRKREVE